jgi:dTDP-4-dehydrorhamnose reductase
VRLLVTGASGYVGGELMRQAPEAYGTYHRNPAVRSLRLDVREAASALQAVAGHDAVIHTAYVQDDDETIVAGSANVAAAAAAAGARLVHISTDVVFGGTLGRPLTEDDAPDPVTGYGHAKAEAERQVAARCPGALIVRTSLVYGGPGREPSRQEAMALEPGTRFFTDELRSPVAVRDLAAALLELVARDVSGPLHVAGADGVSRHEFARLVAAARGGDPGALEGMTTAESGLDRPADCRLDSSRAAGLLGWAPRGVREVLAPPAPM